MLTNWYGMQRSCQDLAGYCKYTGGLCRPGGCPAQWRVELGGENGEKENDNA